MRILGAFGARGGAGQKENPGNKPGFFYNI